MVKIRLWGLPDEIEDAVKSLQEGFKILSESRQYKDKKSEYVRVYVEVESK